MVRGRLRRKGGRADDQGEETEFLEIEPGELTGVLSAPRWLRDLGLMSWLLVGVAAFLAGAVWLLVRDRLAPCASSRASTPMAIRSANRWSRAFAERHVPVIWHVPVTWLRERVPAALIHLRG